MELIVRVNSVNFPTWIPDCDCHNPALLDFFLSCYASICSTMAFPRLGNFDHVVVSVSIDFPSNLKRDSPFHRIAYEYCRADWHGLCDHLRDSQEISKLIKKGSTRGRKTVKIMNYIKKYFNNIQMYRFCNCQKLLSQHGEEI